VGGGGGGGGALKTKFLGYFVFFPIVGRGAKIVEVFRVKNHDFTPVAPPPLDPPLVSASPIQQSVCIWLWFF
jgi:hypothetical protein